MSRPSGFRNVVGRLRVGNDLLVQNSNPLVWILLFQRSAIGLNVLLIRLALARFLRQDLDAPEGLKEFCKLVLREEPSHVCVHPVRGRPGERNRAHLHA